MTVVDSVAAVRLDEESGRHGSCAVGAAAPQPPSPKPAADGIACGTGCAGIRELSSSIIR
jgi:hypothetical protein